MTTEYEKDTLYSENIEDKNQCLLIYNDLSFNYTLLPSEKTLVCITDPPKFYETLLIKLFDKYVSLNKRVKKWTLDRVTKFAEEYVPNLTDYCVVCTDELEFPSKHFQTCGRSKCEELSEEILMDDFVTDFYKHEPNVTKVLLQTMYYAISAANKLMVFEPFPRSFLIDPSKALERGKLSGMLSESEKNNVNNNKDFDSLEKIKQKYSVEQLLNKIKNCQTDNELYHKIGHKTYSLLKFCLKSNKTEMITTQLFDPNSLTNQNDRKTLEKFIQFKVKYHPQVEEDFKNRSKKFGTIFRYHGSGYHNWYSIMRNGLKIMSGTRMMTNGAAHGSGIYLASSINVSMGYMSGSVNIFGVYEMINDQSKFKTSPWGSGTINIAKDENILLLRYLFLVPSASAMTKLKLNDLLDHKFNKKIHEEKRVVKKKTSGKREKRLIREFEKVYKSKNKGFRYELHNDEDLGLWSIYLTDFSKDSQIYKDMKDLGIKEIELEMEFPDFYPIEPPFIRIISPRFEYRTGHITSGGSICMELLTKSGWSPVYSIETLLVDIKSQIIEGGGQIDKTNYKHKYTKTEAKASFYRVATSYGWI